MIMDPIYIGGAVVVAAIVFLVWRTKTKERKPQPTPPERVPGQKGSGSRKGGRR